MLLFRHFLLVLILFTLTSCGFRPLHGNNGDYALNQNLAQIYIEPIPDRIGQVLRNQLRDKINPKGIPKYPDYSLKVSLQESIEHLAVEKTAFATRANLRMTASFMLTSAKNELIGFSGNSSIISSYNILSSKFGTVMAEKEARERAVKQISDEIVIKISFYLSQQQKLISVKNHEALGRKNK